MAHTIHGTQTHLYECLKQSSCTHGGPFTSMSGSYVFQALKRGPFQYEGMRVGQYTNEKNYVWMFEETQFVQLISHVSIATDEFGGAVMHAGIRLVKHLDSHFKLCFILCACAFVCVWYVRGGGG